MGPPSYMWSVADQDIIITVLICLKKHYAAINNQFFHFPSLSNTWLRDNHHKVGTCTLLFQAKLKALRRENTRAAGIHTG